MLADDINITGRSEKEKKKWFTVIKSPADAMELKVNEEKSKYVIVTWNWKQTIVEPYMKIMEYKFDRVRWFVYLGSLVNERKDKKSEQK